MKIRFSDGVDPPNHDEPTYFRKKSARQVIRTLWRHQQQPGTGPTVSESPPRVSPSAPPTTNDNRNASQPSRLTRSMVRGMDETTPETTRCQPVDTLPDVSLCSQFEFPSPAAEQSEERPPSLSPLVSDHGDVNSEDNDDDAASDHLLPGCNASRCAYSLGENDNTHYKDDFVCGIPQCKEYFFCRECLGDCVHNKHSKYMTPFVP